MALPATAVFEVRTTGSDTQCGGGFNSARGGTDYTQQNAAQATGTVTSATTTVTATTGIFTSQMVGNYITDGTTYKEITGFTSSTIVTVDSAPSWTAATIYVGGALATPQKALGLWVAGNTAYVKKSSGYTLTAGLTNTTANATPGSTQPNRLIGYDVTRGDNGKAVLTLSGSSLTGIGMTSTGWWVENFEVDCASQTTSTGISCGAWCTIRNCKVHHFTVKGIVSSGNDGSAIADNEVYSGTSAATAAISIANGHTACVGNYVHDNACTGIAMASSNNGCGIIRNIVANNSGASSDGIVFSYGSVIESNVVYNNGRDGLRNQDFFLANSIRNNVVVNNGAFGLRYTGSVAMPATGLVDYNAFYNNTSGARSNFTAGPHDVTLTGSPFTNAASGDFSLNNTAGAGAACRAAGIPGVFPGGLTTGYLDLGAAQHADSGGSGGYVPSQQLIGTLGVSIG